MARQAVLVLLVSFVSTALVRAQDLEEIPVAGEETLNVSLYTVPFYAVDGAGRPVYDLRADEVTLRVDGELRTVDSFDRWHTASRRSGRSTPPVEVERPPTRFVFLLFDLAFLSPRGLHRSQRIARGVIDDLESHDRLFVLTNDTRRGFRQIAGPVDAIESGRAVIRQAVDALRPNVGQMDAFLEGDFTENGTEIGNIRDSIEAMAGNARSEYREMAELFAESLARFAQSVSSIREPKLLLMFSDGVDSVLYLDGDDGLRSGTDEVTAYHGLQTRRAGPLRYRFEDALAKLAASGVVPGFVSGAGIEAVGRSTLFHMGDASGGRLFEHGSVEVIEETIANATSAYYEAGFYPTTTLDGIGRVEVVIERPGVEVFGPNRLVRQRGYGDLDALTRRNLIVDLIYRDVAGLGLGIPATIPGTVRSREAEAGSELLFRPELPTSIHGRKVDLYEVMLAVGEGVGKPRVLRYDRTVLTAPSVPLELVAALPDDGPVLWGVVAVDVVTGRAYYRRFEVSKGS